MRHEPAFSQLPVHAVYITTQLLRCPCFDCWRLCAPSGSNSQRIFLTAPEAALTLRSVQRATGCKGHTSMRCTSIMATRWVTLAGSSSQALAPLWCLAQLLAPWRTSSARPQLRTCAVLEHQACTMLRSSCRLVQHCLSARRMKLAHQSMHPTVISTAPVPPTGTLKHAHKA